MRANIGRTPSGADFGYAGYVLWRGSLPEAALATPAALEVGIRCTGYPGGHGIFYFVPGPGDSVAPGERLVNWGMYVQVAAEELADFMTDHAGHVHAGSLPPGCMAPATEQALKAAAQARLPEFYAEIVERSRGTYAYAVYDCEVPAYACGRICLAGDAGAFSRPHSGAGALKGMQDAIALGNALATADSVDAALAAWDGERTAANNRMVRFGNQLGRAFVLEIPDWSRMSETEMEQWYSAAVTIESDYLRVRR